VKSNSLIFLLIRNFTFLGNIFPQFLICASICLLVDFERGYYITGIWGWAYFTNLIIKNTIRRPRPDPTQHKVHVGGFSFASGHAFTSLALYFAIAEYFNDELSLWLKLIVLAMPFLLGLSRLYLRVHYMTDVFGGWVISCLYLKFLSPYFTEFHRQFFEGFYAAAKLIFGWI